MGWSILLRILFYFIYWIFFNNYITNTRDFALTSISTIVPILFEAICLCFESEEGSYRNIAGIVAFFGATILIPLIWTLIENTQQISFTGIPFIRITISKEVMWFVLLGYLMSPLTYNLVRKEKKV